MTIFQDIHTSDKQLKNSYITYFLTERYRDAMNIISDNPQLNSKTFVAECINEISDILYLEEEIIYNNINPYLNNLSNEFNRIINQFINKQSWSATTDYSLYNFVIYNNLVYMYINSAPSTGHLPTDNNYWLEIGLRGEKGADGISNIRVKYNWNSTSTYQALDLVIYNNSLWVAKQSNSGQAPSTSPSYWELFLSPAKAEIYVSTNEAERFVGNIWYEILN